MHSTYVDAATKSRSLRPSSGSARRLVAAAEAADAAAAAAAGWLLVDECCQRRFRTAARASKRAAARACWCACAGSMWDPVDGGWVKYHGWMDKCDVCVIYDVLGGDYWAY